MAFTINDLLAKILSGWGLDLSKVLAQAEAVKAKYPDLTDRINAFEAWLSAQVPDSVSVANTIKGIAADIISGASGVDPKAWRASV